VTDAQHSRDEDYGIDRLTASLAGAPGTAGELLAKLEADLDAFTEGAPQQDDVTMLILTRN
jgi:serine phosphatase RsbU (regulator of sigma subunit)